MFAGPTDTWQSAIGLFLIFFVFKKTKKKKKKPKDRLCDNHGLIQT